VEVSDAVSKTAAAKRLEWRRAISTLQPWPPVKILIPLTNKVTRVLLGRRISSMNRLRPKEPEPTCFHVLELWARALSVLGIIAVSAGMASAALLAVSIMMTIDSTFFAITAAVGAMSGGLLIAVMFAVAASVFRLAVVAARDLRIVRLHLDEQSNDGN
jgi:hypothetical protein